MKSEKIIREIRRRLDGLDIAEGATTPEWTRAIKTELCQLGNKLNYWTCASACEVAHGGEYLFDVTWLGYDGNFLTTAALVAECEWSNFGHISEDFQKLLIARADIRLMIFDGSHSPYSQVIAENLARQVRYFRRSSYDELWLFAAWEADEEKDPAWRFRWYTIRRGKARAVPPAAP